MLEVASPMHCLLPVPNPQPRKMDVSLYQIARESQSASEPTIIGLLGFKFLLSSLIDTAIALKQPTRLWVKLPSAEVWQADIERYCRQADSNCQVYCYLYDPRIWSNLTDNPKTKEAVTPIVLEGSHRLKGEFLVLLASEQFSLAVIARRVAQNLESPSKKAHVSTIITSEPQTLKKIAAGLQQAASATPEIDLPVANSAPSGLTNLLAQTLLQVLHKQDETKRASVKAPNNEESIPTFSGFTPTISLLDRLLEELQVPLTTMKTALKLVGSESLKPPQRQRYVDMLNQQCDRQTSLVSGLLEFVQIQQLIEHASLQSLRLSDIIPVVVSTYQPLAQEKGIQLGYTVPEKLPEIITFEPWLKQIVIHLLHNSIKFTPSGGRVSVIATEKDDFVELEVRDTGISIPSQDLTSIFDWFYRTKNTSSGENTGSGIGLAIVQSLLESSGGSISVASRVGQGTSFKVLLPTRG